jgi:hypothetical protein
MYIAVRSQPKTFDGPIRVVNRQGSIGLPEERRRDCFDARNPALLRSGRAK